MGFPNKSAFGHYITSHYSVALRSGKKQNKKIKTNSATKQRNATKHIERMVTCNISLSFMSKIILVWKRKLISKANRTGIFSFPNSKETKVR